MAIGVDRVLDTLLTGSRGLLVAMEPATDLEWVPTAGSNERTHARRRQLGVGYCNGVRRSAVAAPKLIRAQREAFVSMKPDDLLPDQTSELRCMRSMRSSGTDLRIR